MADNEERSEDEGISEDDWAAAMEEQEQVEANQSTRKSDDEAAADSDMRGDTNEAQKVADELAAAAESDSPFQAKPASQVFQDFSAEEKKPGSLNDFDMIMDIPVQITVELGRTKLSIRHLLQLAHGSVVELDGLAGEPMDVLVNGTLIAQGEVVVVNDKFGIRLTDIITPAERMRKLRH